MFWIILKKVALYFKYICAKYKYRKTIKFNGYTIFYAHPGSQINISDKGGIVINSSSVTNLIGMYQRTIISCRGNGVINIGANVGISSSTIYSLDSITIEDNVLIGANCKIIDNDFHPIEVAKRDANKIEDIHKKPIVIGENTFVGMNSIVLKGTRIGKNSIVGAGSVVHGEYPDNCVIAGNPAKIIKSNH